MTEATALTDRELDIWLEERLFGARNCERDCWAPVMTNGSFGGYALAGKPHLHGPEADYFVIAGNYSSTGDGMLAVTTKLLELGFTITIENHPRWGRGWFCEVFDGERNGVAKQRDSAPRAVAEAARRALVERPDSPLESQP